MKHGISLVFLLAACGAPTPDKKPGTEAASAKKLPQVHYYSLGRN